MQIIFTSVHSPVTFMKIMFRWRQKDNVKSNRTDKNSILILSLVFFHVFDHGALQFQQNDLKFLGEVNGVVKYLKSKKKKSKKVTILRLR